MGDERKDQNLPARPTSSLMGQLVRQRQASEVVPAQQQNTGIQGGGQGTGVGARPGSGPAPGQSGMARPGGAASQHWYVSGSAPVAVICPQV
jgi:uncharacterized membrane protein